MSSQKLDKTGLQALVKEINKSINTKINAIKPNIESVTDEKVKMSDGSTLKEYSESLKQSVTNGKKYVAGKISDKGIETPAGSTFKEIGDNVAKISNKESYREYLNEHFEVGELNNVKIENNSLKVGNVKKTYLYNEGDECVNVTGGWEKVTLRNQGGSFTQTKESNCLNISTNITVPYPTHVGFATINKINLKKDCRLFFEYEATGLSSSSEKRYVFMGTLIDKNTNNNEVNTRYNNYINGASGRNIASINTNEIDLNYVSCTAGYNNTNVNLKIYKVWTEEYILETNQDTNGYRISPEIKVPKHQESSISWDGDGSIDVVVTNEIDKTATLMLHCETLLDSTENPKTVINNGVTINNSGKFGSGLNLGLNQYLTVANGMQDVDLSKDFTIEWWEYSTATSENSSGFFTNRSIPSANSACGIHLGFKGNLLFTGNSSGTSWNGFRDVAFKDKVNNVWCHWRLVKEGTKWTSYKNGVEFWSATNSVVPGKTDGDNCAIGAWVDPTSAKSGYNAIIDELRICNYAMCSQDFIPPTAPYGNNNYIPQVKDENIKGVKPKTELKSIIKKTYLYKTGDECVDITGGFSDYPVKYGHAQKSLIKHLDKLEFNAIANSASMCRAGTTNTINIGDNIRLCIDIEIISGRVESTYNYSDARISSSKAWDDTGVMDMLNFSGRKIISMDISSLVNLDKYVSLYASNASSTNQTKFYVYNIWLEKDTFEEVETGEYEPIKLREIVTGNQTISNVKLNFNTPLSVNEVVPIDERSWLYRDGKEYEDIIGGWEFAYMYNGSYGIIETPSMQKNQDHIYIQQNQGSSSMGQRTKVICKNKINLTDYTKLKCIVSIDGAYENNLYVTDVYQEGKQTSYNSTSVAKLSIKDTNSNKKEYTLDISNIKSTNYIAYELHSIGGSKKTKIHRIWLEK